MPANAFVHDLKHYQYIYSVSVKILGIFFVFFSFSNLFSQQALDFKMTDINNIEWHLQTELDKGKTVLLDFFFADCLPCQTLTPQVVNLYNNYGNDTGKVTVFGISDRDDNARLKTFESNFGVNYPSCGIEGGGDTITALYRSWFPFSGWPTYAVICPNKNMEWDLDKNNGLPEIRSAINECILYTSVNESSSDMDGLNFFPNPFQDHLYLKIGGADDGWYEIISLSGKSLKSGFISRVTGEVEVSTQSLEVGMYFIHLRTERQSYIYKLIKTQ